MARDFKRTTKLAVISDLNATPLIDWPFASHYLYDHDPGYRAIQPDRLARAVHRHASAAPEKKDRFITIDAQGLYHWDNDPVGKSELAAQLDQIMQAEGEQPVIHIRGTGIFYGNRSLMINMLKEKPNQVELGHEGRLASPSYPSLACIFAIAWPMVVTSLLELFQMSSNTQEDGLNQLKAALGSCVRTDDDTLFRSSFDGLRVEARPDAVVQPESGEQVGAVLDCQ